MNYKRTIKSLFQFTGVYVLSIFAIAFSYGDAFIPKNSGHPYILALFITLALFAAYEAGKGNVKIN